MARLTTSYYTLEVSRYGRSGPENERRIDQFIQDLLAAQSNDKYISVDLETYGCCRCETVTESVD
jgi:hypothetical protein